MNKRHLLNLSGHKLSPSCKADLLNEYLEVEEIPIPVVDFSGDVGEQLISMLSGTKVPLDGSVPIAIVPPGHSTLAILMVTFLHGVLGHFPMICMLQSGPDGEYRPVTTFSLDGQAVRQAGRAFRQQAWNASGEQ